MITQAEKYFVSNSGYYEFKEIDKFTFFLNINFCLHTTDEQKNYNSYEIYKQAIELNDFTSFTETVFKTYLYEFKIIHLNFLTHKPKFNKFIEFINGKYITLIDNYHFKSIEKNALIIDYRITLNTELNVAPKHIYIYYRLLHDAYEKILISDVLKMNNEDILNKCPEVWRLLKKRTPQNKDVDYNSRLNLLNILL